MFDECVHHTASFENYYKYFFILFALKVIEAMIHQLERKNPQRTIYDERQIWCSGSSNY